MPRGPQGQKRPADVIGNAVKVMRIATGEEEETVEPDPVKSAAAELGARGGKARAAKLTPERRSEVARAAARKRWGKAGRGKYRVSYGSKGKRGGARVIYYFHDREMPIYLLAVYKKSEKINLSDVERATMKKLVQQLVAMHRVRNFSKLIS